MTWQIIEYPEVTSSNDVAIDLSATPPADKFVITAATQTHGRGRRGRSWYSAKGNLYMSQAFPLDDQNMTAMVFVISLSLYQALKSFAPAAELQLKWPNDILLKNHKVSGILLEKGKNGYIIAGIGVNLQTKPAHYEPMLYPAAALADFGITISPRQLLETYLRMFDNNFALWQEHGFEPIRHQWLKFAKGLGQEITVNLPTTAANGIFEGIDATGALILRQGDKIRKILAGDVFYKKKEQNI